MKNIAPLAVGGALVITGVVGVMVLKNKTAELPGELLLREQSQRQSVTGSAESVVSIVTETPAAEVPLPREEDIIRTFFALIDEGRPGDAVSMMSKVNTEDDSAKQAWAVQFNAFESVVIKLIDTDDKTDTTDKTNMYKVTLEVRMKPESKNEVIPYFGWENGENTRWVELVRENGLWKVNGIATGP